jgi:hypothetical protein
LQPLALNVPRLIGEARDVPTGPAEACDDARAQRVANGRKDDWDGRRCRLGGLRRERPESCYQHIGIGLNQLHGQ